MQPPESGTSEDHFADSRLQPCASDAESAPFFLQPFFCWRACSQNLPSVAQFQVKKGDQGGWSLSQPISMPSSCFQFIRSFIGTLWSSYERHLTVVCIEQLNWISKLWYTRNYSLFTLLGSKTASFRKGCRRVRGIVIWSSKYEICRVCSRKIIMTVKSTFLFVVVLLYVTPQYRKGT